MEHPTGCWLVQQLREAFPESCPYRYMILDRDAKFGNEVADLLTAIGVEPTRTSFARPWQNGIAERWVESCRRDLLDYLIILNEHHLRRLMRDYISYYHTDRTHDSLGKDTPAMRPVSPRPQPSATLVSFPRIGGLHHRYDWPQASLRKAVDFSHPEFSGLSGHLSYLFSAGNWLPSKRGNPTLWRDLSVAQRRENLCSFKWDPTYGDAQVCD